MAVHPEHDKILMAAAQGALAPLGFTRKGKSRLYLSDEGLWSCIAEFQPSGTSQGSYVNVAAHWLWTTADHISLDYGGRIGGFVAFHDLEQWRADSGQLASSARKTAEQLRETFGSVQDIARILTKAAFSGRSGGWDVFHAAVASALAGDIETSRGLFSNVAQENSSSGWERALQADARHLMGLADNPELLRKLILERVAASRHRLGLAAGTGLPSP